MNMLKRNDYQKGMRFRGDESHSRAKIIFVSAVILVLSWALPEALRADGNAVLRKVVERASSQSSESLNLLPELDWGYDAFKVRAEALDSLLAIHTSLDTVGGRIGHERVAGIARGYMEVGRFEDALRWWKILYRVDKKRDFLEQSVTGRVISAVALSDSSEMVSICEEAAAWPDPLKYNLGGYFLAILDILRMRGADNLWVRDKLETIRQFLPKPDVLFLDAQLHMDIRDYSSSYATYKKILGEYSPSSIDSIQSVELLQGLVFSSYFTGQKDECRALLGEILQFGSTAIANKARVWRAHFSMLDGRTDEAKSYYTVLCEDNIEDSCFWKDYIERLVKIKKEINR